MLDSVEGAIHPSESAGNRAKKRQCLTTIRSSRDVPVPSWCRRDSSTGVRAATLPK